MANVEIQSVGKYYPGDVEAVKDFSLSAMDGEFIVLVGPSGCGKTTTMRMIAGLETITSGRILFDDTDVSTRIPKDRDVAMVFQNYALFPHLNVYSNIAFGMRLRKVPKDEIERQVTDVAQLLGLEPYLRRKPKELSGGQRQRVALGRAIVRSPEVFVMDEPLSNIDAKMRVETRSEIIKLQRRLGVTTFYVTHDQVEALSMGDRIVVMNEGRVQQIGTPTELYAAPDNRYVAGFIGSPAMNFLSGVIDEGVINLSDIDKSLSIPEKVVDRHREGGAGLWVGLRPEHIQMLGEADQTAEYDYSIPGEVEVVEPLGFTTRIHIKFGDQVNLDVLLTRSVSEKPGDRVNACFNESDLYLFDADTDQAIA